MLMIVADLAVKRNKALLKSSNKSKFLFQHRYYGSGPYGQQGNESTAAWLKRLISLGAPADIRADVRQILAGEQQQAGANIQNFVDNGPGGVDKRIFDRKLSNIASLSPSSFAEPKGKHSWSKNFSTLGLNLHRPTREQSGIHTSLMSRELGVFADNVREVQLDHTDYTFTIDFCDAMCAVFVNESERRDVANQLLSEYFDESICKLSGPEEVSNVGAILSQCGTQKRNTFPMLFLNYKWELCSSKASPGEQNAGYYMKNVHESGFARERSACPALLLTIAGPNLGISAAVYGAGPCVDPVVPLLPTLILKQDKSMMTMVARALKACKLCIGDLSRHYSALSNSAMPADEVQQLMFPYPRSFQFEDREVHFAYDRQLGDKLVFEAHVTSGMAMDLNIIVKFTDTYCVEAHELCYKCDESAPRLYSHSLLPGEWHMLVMESLAGEDFRPKLESASVENNLTQVVNHLHNAGLVHGDLRGGNVRVVGERVCLLDFAWSGQAGKQRYPGFMNHTNIDWAELASDGLPLETAHDLHMLKQLVRRNSL